VKGTDKGGAGASLPGRDRAGDPGRGSGASGTTDLLGRPVRGADAELLEVYTRLRDLAGRENLAPCVTANVRHALGYVGVAVTDLGLDFEHLLDRGT
jgi:hypothetical protein